MLYHSTLRGSWGLARDYQNPSWELTQTNKWNGMTWYDMIWLCGFLKNPDLGWEGCLPERGHRFLLQPVLNVSIWTSGFIHWREPGQFLRPDPKGGVFMLKSAVAMADDERPMVWQIWQEDFKKAQDLSQKLQALDTEAYYEFRKACCIFFQLQSSATVIDSCQTALGVSMGLQFGLTEWIPLP